MTKKILTFILCIAIIINLFTIIPITAYAFDRTTYNKLCPITVYPCTEDDDFPAYSTVECTTKSGRIYRTDRCTIIKFYKNSNGDNVCKVKYPVSGGGTKTAYAKTSRFIYDKSFTVTSMIATAKTNVSAYAGASAISGWYINSGDKIFALGRDGNGNTQIAYPIDDGYKVAWIKYYNVKFNANGGSSAPSIQYKTQNTNLTLSGNKPSRTGYTFHSWNTEKNGSGTKYLPGGTYKSNSKVTLYAQWTINSYKLTVNSANTSMGSVSGGGTYNYGKSVTLKAVPKAGYSFVKWSDGNTSATRTISITKAATYTATFKANSYSITANSNNKSMGTASGSGTYSYGSNISIKANPESHYHFVKWSDGNTLNPRTVTVGASNATYTAIFAIDTHKITVNSGDTTMGTVSGSSTYNYSSKAVIHAFPNEEYKFVKWSDGDTSQSREITVTNDASYTAYFEYDPGTCQHSYGEWNILQPASCVATGKKTRTCSKCSNTESSIIELLSHQYNDEWIIDTAATCEEDGLKNQTCSSCGEAKISEVIPALGHDFSIWEITQYPNCTENGIKDVFCSRCSKIDLLKSQTIEADGHSWGDWITDKNASCTESGLKHRVCSVANCQMEEQEVMEEIGHQIKETKIEATENRLGVIRKECINIIGNEKCNYLEEIPLYPTINAGSLSTESFYVKQGDLITVPVRITDNPGITGFTIMLQYDSNIITPKAKTVTNEKTGKTEEKLVSPGDVIPNASLDCYSAEIDDNEHNTNAMFIVSYPGTTTTYNNGVLFYVDFIVNANANSGVYPIVISYKEIIGEDFDSDWQVGDIEQSFISVLPTTENGVIIVTDESSSVVMRGDVNLDGLVNLIDRILLSRYIVKTEQFNQQQTEAADVYADNNINTKDSVRLSQLIIGLEFNDTNLLSTVNSAPTIITVGKCEGIAGDYIDVPVIIESNSGIAGFHFNLSFDKDYLYPVSIIDNGILGDEITTNIQENEDNSNLDLISLQWSESDNIFAEGTICTIRFKLKNTAYNGQVIPIELSAIADDPVCAVSGTEIKDVPIEMNSGNVTVENKVSATGKKYRIESLTYTLSDGTKTDTIPVDTEFNATVNFTPLTDELTLGTIIVALYDNNNRIIGVQSKAIDLKMLMNESYTFDIPKHNNISKISVYIWDSLNTLKPLSNNKNF